MQTRRSLFKSLLIAPLVAGFWRVVPRKPTPIDWGFEMNKALVLMERRTVRFGHWDEEIPKNLEDALAYGEWKSKDNLATQRLVEYRWKMRKRYRTLEGDDHGGLGRMIGTAEIIQRRWNGGDAWRSVDIYEDGFFYDAPHHLDACEHFRNLQLHDGEPMPKLFEDVRREELARIEKLKELV